MQNPYALPNGFYEKNEGAIDFTRLVRLWEHGGILIKSKKVHWTIEIGIGPICSIMKWYSIEEGLIGSKKIHTCTYFEEW